MTDTYQERIFRYRLLRHDELPDRHKAEMRLHGIDPDDNWQLVWSFREREAAELQLAFEIENAPSYSTWKLVDAGKETVITRSAWI